MARFQAAFIINANFSSLVSPIKRASLAACRDISPQRRATGLATYVLLVSLWGSNLSRNHCLLFIRPDTTRMPEPSSLRLARAASRRKPLVCVRASVLSAGERRSGRGYLAQGVPVHTASRIEDKTVLDSLFPLTLIVSESH